MSRSHRRGRERQGQGLALVPRAACSPRGEPGAHTKIRGGAGRRAPAVASGSVLQGSFSESGACLPSRVGGQGQQGRRPRAALPTFHRKCPRARAALRCAQVVSAPAAHGVPGRRSGVGGTRPGTGSAGTRRRERSRGDAGGAPLGRGIPVRTAPGGRPCAGRVWAGGVDSTRPKPSQGESERSEPLNFS